MELYFRGTDRVFVGAERSSISSTTWTWMDGSPWNIDPTIKYHNYAGDVCARLEADKNRLNDAECDGGTGSNANDYIFRALCRKPPSQYLQRGSIIFTRRGAVCLWGTRFFLG